MESLRVGCLLMAAGSGSRFGGCKLQAELDGKTLLERALETIPDGVFAKTVVVTSPELPGMWRDIRRRSASMTGRRRA